MADCSEGLSTYILFKLPTQLLYNYLKIIYLYFQLRRIIKYTIVIVYVNSDC